MIHTYISDVILYNVQFINVWIRVNIFNIPIDNPHYDSLSNKYTV